jgi:hypothetical protein
LALKKITLDQELKEKELLLRIHELEASEKLNEMKVSQLESNREIELKRHVIFEFFLILL